MKAAGSDPGRFFGWGVGWWCAGQNETDLSAICFFTGFCLIRGGISTSVRGRERSVMYRPVKERER